LLLSRKAQSIVEYVVALGLISTVFVGMQVYIRRSVQARIKDMTDVMLPAGTVSGDVAQLGHVTPIIPLLDPDPITGETSKYSSSTSDISESKTAQAQSDVLVRQIHRNASSRMHLAQPDPSKDAGGTGAPPTPLGASGS